MNADKQQRYIDFVTDLFPGLSRAGAVASFNVVRLLAAPTIVSAPALPQPLSNISGLSPMGYFSDRDKSLYPTAEDFLREAYKGRLGIEGDLDQPTFRRIDQQLMAALDIEFRGPEGRSEFRKLIPRVSDRSDQKLFLVLGYIPEGEERRSALNSLARGHTPKPRR